MKWVKRGFLTLLALLVVFVGIIVIRKATVQPAEAGAASVKFAPAPEVDVDLAAARAHSPKGAPVAPMLVLGGTDSRYHTSISENVCRFAPEWGL